MYALTKKTSPTFYLGLVSTTDLPNASNDSFALWKKFLIPYHRLESKQMTLFTNGTKQQFSRLPTSSYNYIPTADQLYSKIEHYISLLPKDKEFNLVLHLSSHGFQANNIIALGEVNESDGKDEMFYWGKYKGLTQSLRDDRINELLKLLPEKAKVLMLVDTCHSGTMADLPYKDGVYKPNNVNYKAQVLCISGCSDHQTLTEIYNKELRMSLGSCTQSFIDSYDKKDWLEVMRSKLLQLGQIMVVSSMKPLNEVFEKREVKDIKKLPSKSKDNIRKNNCKDEKVTCKDEKVTCNKKYWWLWILIFFILFILLYIIYRKN